MINRNNYVTFISKKLETNFESLKENDSLNQIFIYIYLKQ